MNEPDMTVAEAMKMIRDRCPARDWNMVISSSVYQYSPSYEGADIRPPAIRYSVSVWRRDQSPHITAAHDREDTLRSAVESVLEQLPAQTAPALQLLALPAA